MSAPVSPESRSGPPLVLPPELRPTVEHLVTEDDEPVDVYSKKQQSLLIRPLYSSWSGPGEGRPFLALANVGMFFAINQPPLVPDFLLSLDVRPPDDLKQKSQRSYFFWEIGKPPEGIVEIVSNLEGDELGQKLHRYAQIGIPLYVVWDPMRLLGQERLHVFDLRFKTYAPNQGLWFPELNLGLTVWHGSFDQCDDDWLRWCDEQGQVIPTGEERAEQERQRADKAEQRAQRLADKLRELGVEPNDAAG